MLSDEEGPPFVPNTRGSSLAYFHISTIIKSNKHLRAVVRRVFFYGSHTGGAVRNSSQPYAKAWNLVLMIFM